MQYTTNQNLKKPQGTDYVNIDDINYNSDKLDGLIPAAASSSNQLIDRAAQNAIDATKEVTANKVTSISASSTDTQYPSAKCVYDLIGNVKFAVFEINALTGVLSVTYANSTDITFSLNSNGHLEVEV